MKKYFILTLVLFISPVSLFAVTTLKTFVNNAINNVAYGLISSIIAVAVLAFFVGIIKFLYASRNGVEQGVTEGKQTMLWSVISIFVMLSLFGIVKLAQNISGTNVTEINMPALRDTMFRQPVFQSINQNTNNVQSSALNQQTSLGEPSGSGPVSDSQSDSFLNNLNNLFDNVDGSLACKYDYKCKQTCLDAKQTFDSSGNCVAGGGLKKRGAVSSVSNRCSDDISCVSFCISEGNTIDDVSGSCVAKAGQTRCGNDPACVSFCTSEGRTIDDTTGDCVAVNASSNIETQIQSSWFIDATIDGGTGMY